jgi:uncharacterized protein
VSARLRVRVQPGARVAGVVGRDAEGALQVKVREPAREGRANQAVEALLAERLRVPRGAVRVVRGAASRNKWIEIAGLEPEALEARLRAALEAPSGSER